MRRSRCSSPGSCSRRHPRGYSRTCCRRSRFAPRGVTADEIRRALEDDCSVVPEPCGSRDVRSEVIPLDRVAAVRREPNRCTVERDSIDDQSANGAAPRADGESVAAADDAGCVDLDDGGAREVGSPAPSIMTGSVIVGSGDASVIVYGRLSMSKSIVSAPPAAFASMIACRNEPPPESSVDVTRNVASGADCAPASPITSTTPKASVTRWPSLPRRRNLPLVNSRWTLRAKRHEYKRPNHSPSQNASASPTATSNPAARPASHAASARSTRASRAGASCSSSSV